VRKEFRIMRISLFELGLVVLLTMPLACSDARDAAHSGEPSSPAAMNGSPVVLATGLDSPHSLVVETDYAYLAVGALSRKAASIVRIPTDGGATETLVSNLTNPAGLVIDAGALYFASYDDDEEAWTIDRVSLASGEREGLASDTNIVTFDVGGGYVYWTVPEAGLVSAGRVMRVPTTGGEPEEVARENVPRNLEIGRNYAYYVTGGANGSLIKQVPLAGGTPVSLLTTVGGIRGLIVEPESASLYWLESASIKTMALGEESSHRVAKMSEDDDVSMVATAGALYWTECNISSPDNGKVLTLLLPEGEASTLAERQSCPANVVRSGASLYWTTFEKINESGSLQRLAL